MNYEKLFTYMSKEHGIMLLESDMQQIIRIVDEIKIEDRFVTDRKGVFTHLELIQLFDYHASIHFKENTLLNENELSYFHKLMKPFSFSVLLNPRTKKNLLVELNFGAILQTRFDFDPSFIFNQIKSFKP